MTKQLIRPVPSNTVRQAAKAANAARRAQSAQKRTEQQIAAMFAWVTNYAPEPTTTKVPNTDTLADLLKFVEKVQEVHTAQVMTLVREMDNLDETPIMVYKALKGTFGRILPNYTDWVKTA